MTAVAQHLVAQHLGALHPIETLVTLVLAFGPFVALGLVVLARRRRETRTAAQRER